MAQCRSCRINWLGRLRDTKLAGEQVEHINTLRHLLPMIDPALLTREDRAALLDLIGRAFDATNSGGGGVQAVGL